MTFITTIIITLLIIVALIPVWKGVYKTIQHLGKYKSSKRKLFLSACPLIAQLFLAFYIFDIDHLVNPEIRANLNEPFDTIFIMSPIIYAVLLICNLMFFILEYPELL